MLNLAEYRSARDPRTSCLAALEQGVVLNKTSFQRTARSRTGPRQRDAGRAGRRHRLLNNALRRLGSGWAIFVEAQRIAAQTYPHSTFPDPASPWSISNGRTPSRRQAHFESRYF